jgi:hypothetical protein
MHVTVLVTSDSLLSPLREMQEVGVKVVTLLRRGGPLEGLMTEALFTTTGVEIDL